MEERESILEEIHDDDVNFEDYEEEGELVDENLQPISGQTTSVDAIAANLDSESNKCTNKKKKKRRGDSAPDVIDINRFVLETCRCLKEKKSYMVYTAVGCLGVSTVNDLVKEVYAIQSCGGQMTADGRRTRSGGSILWNIIKARAPSAYTEIMKKTKEFEKQFKQQNIRSSGHDKEGSAQIAVSASTSGTASISEGTPLMPQNKHEQPYETEENRKLVHDRIRVPVSYDDDLLGDDSKNNLTNHHSSRLSLYMYIHTIWDIKEILFSFILIFREIYFGNFITVYFFFFLAVILL